MFEKLSQKLKTIIQANTLIQDVYNYERADANGNIFATITPSANENEYHSTTENRRTYSFLIRLFVERGGETESETCEKAMRELVDSVLNNLDSNYLLSGLATQSGYTFLFMSAVPSKWGYVGREMNYRVAEIVVNCHFDVDVTLIS